ncbi:MAG: triose-phosphate isomerase [Gemmatimonadota bacterium]
MRRPLIAANWKMHLGRADEAQALVRAMMPALSRIEQIEVAICPPFTVLHALFDVLRSSAIALGAQNMHSEDKGAHTGETSPLMLAGLCQYVILGHSERRAMGGTGDTDEAINRKVGASFAHGLIPILCVGEDSGQHERGDTDVFVRGQVESALQGVTPEQVASCVVAYEPIWAIGSGKAANPADANRTIGITIRGAVADRFGEEAAQAVRVLYGGSVTAASIAGFMAMPEIDGALVGGASLKPEFAELVAAAVPS